MFSQRRSIGVLILWSILVILAGCRSSDEPTPPRAPGFEVPRVTGILVTDGSGNWITTWGNPDEDYAIPHKIAINSVYPNPSTGDFYFLLAVTSEIKLTMWITPAIGPGEKAPDIAQMYQNAGVLVPGGLAIRVLLYQEFLAPGIHEINWNGKDETLRPVPSGFYRVYLQAYDRYGGVYDKLAWRNLLIAREPSELPPGFPPIFARP